MAEVTIDTDVPAAPTPSEQLVRQANAETTVTDDRGRKLTFKRPGPLAQFQIVEAMGDAATNGTLMQMVNPLIYVVAIDGEPVFLPAKRSEVDALILKLGDEGLAALNVYYFDVVIKPMLDAAEAAKQQERLKN
jgi:hypothetical protein